MLKSKITEKINGFVVIENKYFRVRAVGARGEQYVNDYFKEYKFGYSKIPVLGKARKDSFNRDYFPIDWSRIDENVLCIYPKEYEERKGGGANGLVERGSVCMGYFRS